jgi:urease accessory protein
MDGPSGTSELDRPHVDHVGHLGWTARLELRFARLGGATRVVRRLHEGPLQVQRPFYPDKRGGCHVYILHPPGGIVGGDRLDIHVTTEAGTEALLTTPAATKFYRSAGPVARQSVQLEVGSGSLLEWLPQETIVFGGARARSTVVASVEPGGRFIGWDVCCLGRPLSGDPFASGFYAPRFELYAGGRPAFIERAHVDAAGPLRGSRIGLAGAPVFGSLVALADSLPGWETATERIRAVLPGEASDGVFSVTSKSRAVVCRYLGHDVQRAREGFTCAWRELRQILSMPATAPRIWAT